jgi:hypothetical protein
MFLRQSNQSEQNIELVSAEISELPTRRYNAHDTTLIICSQVCSTQYFCDPIDADLSSNVISSLGYIVEGIDIAIRDIRRGE